MASPSRRSRSPERDAAPSSKKPRKDKGFRWKDEPRPKDRDRTDRPERKERPARERDDEPRRDDRDRGNKASATQADETPREPAASSASGPVMTGPGLDMAAKFGARAANKYRATASTKAANSKPEAEAGSTAVTTSSSTSRADGSAEKKPKSAKVAAPVGPMILVTVNDRLGTKAQIPCLPSDTVGDFKKIVAMKIGRKPHEIMIKRQSERPFKDILTLEDYGVSNGVQLDLELDTGD